MVSESVKQVRLLGICDISYHDTAVIAAGQDITENKETNNERRNILIFINIKKTVLKFL